MDTKQKKSLKFRFWNYLRQKSISKIKDIHSKKYADIKCPNCEEWFSISGIDYKHISTKIKYNNNIILQCKCGKCQTTNYWNLSLCPAPIISNKFGTPIQIEKNNLFL